MLDDYHEYFVLGIVLKDSVVHLDELCQTINYTKLLVSEFRYPLCVVCYRDTCMGLKEEN